MPNLQVFVLGETMRRGVMGRPESRIGVQLFLIVFSLVEYTVFAPVYWYWMFRRWRGKPICAEQAAPLVVDDADQPDAGCV